MAKEVWDSTTSALSDVVPIIGAFDVVVKLIGSIHETRPKVHKERVARLKGRIDVLDGQLQTAGRTAVETAQLQRTRVRLEELLEEALSLMRKLEDTGWIKRFIKKGTVDGDFTELNQRLSQESLSLILSLNIDAKVMQETFNVERRRTEDEKDRETDTKLLEEMKETLLDIKDDTEEIKAIVKETNKMVKRMSEDSGEKSPPPGLFSSLPPSYSSAVSAPPLPLPPEPGFCPYPQDPAHLPMPQPPLAANQPPVAVMTSPVAANQPPLPVMTSSPVTNQQPVIQLASPASYHPQVVYEPLQASSPSSPIYQPQPQPVATVISQHHVTSQHHVISQLGNQPQVVPQTVQPLANQHAAPQVIQPVIRQPVVIDQQPTVNTTASTIVHVGRDLGTSPTPAMCHVCQRQIHTRVVYRSGLFTWAMCGLLILFGLMFGCCLIPFFIDSCKDAHHSCPRCNTPLSVSKKC